MVLIDNNQFIDMDNWYNRLIDNEMIIDCSAVSGAFWILNIGADELPLYRNYARGYHKY